jgi:ketosteroid isomerase-like protein
MTAEQEIRDHVIAWNEKAARRDVDGCVAYFADDGAFMAPNAPAARGAAAIRQGWVALLALPNLSVAFGPTTVTAAASGDLAYEDGTWSLAFDTPAGRQADHGKYIVVWRKRGREWRVMADIFNSDVPLPG